MWTTLVGLLAVVVGSQVSAEPQRPVAVLELFTSEGCSSCPSADALLERMSARSNVITLSFHVDYWNHLGWKDPYSDAVATDRQHAYAMRLARGRTYTPQLVVNGEHEFLGSDAARLNRALDKPRGLTTVVTITRVRLNNGQVEVSVDSTSSRPVTLFLVQRRAEGVVTRGENAGEVLRHVNVVRSTAVVTAGKGSAVLPVPAGASGLAVVALVQEAESLRMEGAAIRAVE